jgi:DNA-binding transcriptional ArsR family regulator
MRAAPYSQLRVAARLANAFALDLVKLGGFGRDVVDALLLAAISQANVAQITRSPELQRQYATLDQAPPDELRRPVSINAIAGSLRMPFETARRRIAALKELGVIKVTPQGVIVPQAPLVSPLYRTTAEQHYSLVRELYLRLRSIGMFEDLPQTPPIFDAENRPVRLVVRLSSDYVLRLAEPITKYVGDLVSGLIIMAMVNANTAHLADTEGGENELTPEGNVSDSLRRPVRVSTISERLGIPPETVRRHIARIVQAGICQRLEDGYIVPARAISREGFVEFMIDNQTNLQRLFQGLAEHGVLAMWEREAAGLRGAA